MPRIILIYIMFIFPFQAFSEEIPMWEGIQKNEAMLEADRQFIADIEKARTRKAGAIRALDLGWKFLSEDDHETAIKRFNQAWLLNPSNANIHWGFAMATHLQGKSMHVVERHFKEAENRFSGNTEALAEIMSERARVWGEREKFQKSIEIAKIALKINPNSEYACRVIKISAQQIGDQKSPILCNER